MSAVDHQRAGAFANTEARPQGLKPVRPFRPAPGLHADPAFLPWHKKYPRLLLDLGCGAGLNVIRTAAAKPDTGLVAIERTRNRFRGLQSRLRHHDLPNVFAVGQDARLWLPANLNQPVVEHIFLLYPNPYPKESQANKRWHRQPLMALLLQLLTRDGHLEVASNESWFLDECRAYMTGFWGLQLKADTLIEPSAEPRTHFERKYQRLGETCGRLLFCKN